MDMPGTTLRHWDANRLSGSGEEIISSVTLSKSDSGKYLVTFATAIAVASLEKAELHLEIILNQMYAKGDCLREIEPAEVSERFDL